MKNHIIQYADDKLKHASLSRKEDGDTIIYMLDGFFGDERVSLVYELSPLGKRPGGNAQLFLSNTDYLDFRFEQEESDQSLNEATDIACDYFSSAVLGNLELRIYKLGPFRKCVVLPKKSGKGRVMNQNFVAKYGKAITTKTFVIQGSH